MNSEKMKANYSFSSPINRAKGGNHLKLTIFARTNPVNHMKLFTILSLFMMPFLSFAQGINEGVFEKKIMSLEKRNSALSKELAEVKKANSSLKSEMVQMKNEVNETIAKSQELQAQNEKALNLALDEFSKKFEEQNKTVKGVQDELSTKFSNQLIYFMMGLLAVALIGIVSTRNATKKALSQNVATWNSFQEHLLKK